MKNEYLRTSGIIGALRRKLKQLQISQIQNERETVAVQKALEALAGGNRQRPIGAMKIVSEWLGAKPLGTQFRINDACADLKLSAQDISWSLHRFKNRGVLKVAVKRVGRQGSTYEKIKDVL